MDTAMERARSLSGDEAAVVSTRIVLFGSERWDCREIPVGKSINSHGTNSGTNCHEA